MTHARASPPPIWVVEPLDVRFVSSRVSPVVHATIGRYVGGPMKEARRSIRDVEIESMPAARLAGKRKTADKLVDTNGIQSARSTCVNVGKKPDGSNDDRRYFCTFTNMSVYLSNVERTRRKYFQSRLKIRVELSRSDRNAFQDRANNLRTIRTVRFHPIPPHRRHVKRNERLYSKIVGNNVAVYYYYNPP